jgi:RNA polymerase sigma factor (sigma-70 family)
MPALTGVDEVKQTDRVSGARGDVTLLVRRAGRGDEDAWAALVGRYQNFVWAVVRGHRLSAADAADAAQTTWVRLVEHLDDIQEPERLGPWLATTAHRECLRIIRIARREMPSSHESDLLDAAQEEEYPTDLVDRGRALELWTAFGRLPARSQALLRMLAAEPQPTYREISDALGMPVGSIGPTRARALDQLRYEMGRISAAEKPRAAAEAARALSPLGR